VIFTNRVVEGRLSVELLIGRGVDELSVRQILEHLLNALAQVQDRVL
jgi:hypothetical protein